MIDFLLDAYDLKDVPRKGWVLRGVKEPEQVAGHTWGVTLLTTTFARQAEADLDVLRAVKMAQIHDVAEARTGDLAIGEVYQEVTNEERENQEREAWETFRQTADVEEFFQLWDEFETKSSPEARFVADMDVLDMCLTALKYETQGRYDASDGHEEYDDLDGFFETADKNVETELGRELYDRIYERYESVKRST